MVKVTVGKDGGWGAGGGRGDGEGSKLKGSAGNDFGMRLEY